MDNQNSNSDHKQWFGPKRYGIGTRPVSWQGWLVIVLFIAVEVVLVSIAPSLYPSWFVPKTIGIGYTPVTWQGWFVVLGPIVVLLIIIGVINHKQRQK